MQMKISVVIPTYRRPQLLVRCLEALVRQNFDKNEYEVIVVSDGPDQETSEAMKFWIDTVIPKIRYLSTPAKKGPAASRNAGWMNAAGHLIAFTDDDCLPSPNWLHAAWKAYKGEQLVVFTGKVIVPIPRYPTDYERNISKLETAEFITANCICTRQALKCVGGFDERYRMAWREDSDLHFNFISNEIPIHPIQAVVTHPIREAPWGVSIKEQKKGLYNALLYKKYPALYRQRIKPHPSWNYYAMLLLFSGTVVFFAAGHPFKGLISFLGWLTLLIAFIEKRLTDTSRCRKHVVEMIATSVVIPFASIFWQLYGSAKFRVWFFQITVFLNVAFNY
ncbi:glycosyltransferase [Arcticibacter tournemirensis]|uniref:Glycosyltransferase n=2 Tax=Arcticibacter tournemirensis TaxID=699437 RepID=A0A4Q0MFI9_9SPHI|nr:glycosyltransferase [Arcticibacter tournemirensis]